MSHSPSRGAIWRHYREQQQKQLKENREAALRTVELFNQQLTIDGDLLWTPLLRAALVCDHHWMKVACDGCRTVKMIDLRVVPRPLETPLATIAAKLSCQACRGQGPAARILKLSAQHYL